MSYVSEPAYIFGCDPSTRRVALAWHGPDSGVTSVEIPAKLRGAERLDELYRLTRNMAGLLARNKPPSFCWVEQPFARGHVEPSLYMAVGVVHLAFRHALKFQNDYPVPVDSVVVGAWKARSVGHGAAKKPAILKWARHQHGYEGECLCLGTGQEACNRPVRAHDEADALGIAVAGRALLDEGE